MDHALTVSLVDDTQQKIIEKIASTLEDDSIDKNEYFFKEGDFVNEFNVSRSTVREAVRSLEVRGYVERIHGKGVKAINRSVQVVAHSINDMIMRGGSTMEDMIEVRRIIEVKAAGLAAVRRDEKHCDEMSEYISIMKDKNVNYNKYLDADLAFHRAVTAATKNNILIALVRSYEYILRDAITASTDKDYRPELTQKYHENIYKCILDKDKIGAETAMKNHLDASKKNIEELHKIELSHSKKISVSD